jgi:hypothetical protein
MDAWPVEVYFAKYAYTRYVKTRYLKQTEGMEAGSTMRKGNNENGLQSPVRALTVAKYGIFIIIIVQPEEKRYADPNCTRQTETYGATA